MNSCHQYTMMSGAQTAFSKTTIPRSTANELFVGDLSFFCTEDHLLRLFSEFGAVESVRIIRGGHRKRSLTFGFVTMSSPQEAREMANLFNRHMFMGRNIKVELSEQRRGHQPTIDDYAHGVQVHVAFSSSFTSNNLILPTELLIRQIFSRFGNILDVSVKEYVVSPGDVAHQQGYGFVTYDNETAAMLALQGGKGLMHDGIAFDCTPSHRGVSAGTSGHVVPSHKSYGAPVSHGVHPPSAVPAYSAQLSAHIPVISTQHHVPVPVHTHHSAGMFSGRTGRPPMEVMSHRMPHSHPAHPVHEHAAYPPQPRVVSPSYYGHNTASFTTGYQHRPHSFPQSVHSGSYSSGLTSASLSSRSTYSQSPPIPTSVSGVTHLNGVSAYYASLANTSGMHRSTNNPLNRSIDELSLSSLSSNSGDSIGQFSEQQHSYFNAMKLKQQQDLQYQTLQRAAYGLAEEPSVAASSSLNDLDLAAAYYFKQQQSLDLHQTNHSQLPPPAKLSTPIAGSDVSRFTNFPSSTTSLSTSPSSSNASLSNMISGRCGNIDDFFANTMYNDASEEHKQQQVSLNAFF